MAATATTASAPSAFTAINLSSPGLFGTGNQIAWGVVTDAVYVNGSSQEQTTAWTVGGGFEYFWTRNFSSTIYGTYTEVSYNDTVVNNRWFCGGGGGRSRSSSVGSATCDPGFKYWTVGTHHDWFPLPGLRLAVDVMYMGIESAVAGQTVTLGTKSGARPTGIYPVKDQGITRGHLPRPAQLGRRVSPLIMPGAD